MLGNTVKVRCCPATVGAPDSWSVVWTGQETGQSFSAPAESPSTTAGESIFACGKVAGAGASQETGPRRFNPLAFRGERRRPSCLLQLCAADMPAPLPASPSALPPQLSFFSF